MSILASTSTTRRSTPPSPPTTAVKPMPSLVDDGKRPVSPSTNLHSSSSSRTGTASLSNVNAQQRLLNPPTFIQYKFMQFLVMDAPSDSNLNLYFSYFKKYGVTDIVRACDGTYSKESIEAIGIKLHEMNFKDGDPPPANIVSAWLQLVTSKFQASRTTPQTPSQPDVFEPPTIAVHCVAGLGRAPVLVAIALIEAGMQNLEAVDFIRSKRRGALNVKQIHFLDSYKKKGKNKFQAFLAMDASSNLPQQLQQQPASVAVNKGERAEKCCMM